MIKPHKSFAWSSGMKDIGNHGMEGGGWVGQRCPVAVITKETICMKCQILFSEKNKKKYDHFVICGITP